MKLRFLLSLLIYCCTELQAQEASFVNPVVHGDMADPSIVRIDSLYYLTGTSSEWAPFYPIFKSYDLVNWKQTGHVFEKQPEWTKSSFWAPEWFLHQGKVYLYYTARRKTDGVSYIGVAVADSPEGPFEDRGVIVEWGSEAIDAFLLEDQHDLYISWKAYGLDKRPIELLACKLTPDGLRLDGEPFSLLRDDDRQGMEGQHWFKQGDYYYLIYSINGCCGPNSDYSVSVARSRSLKGPYEIYKGNPVLQASDEVLSIGHGTLTTTPDGRMFYLCHAYSRGAAFYQGRTPYLVEMRMDEHAWPYFVPGEKAVLSQPMPMPGYVQEPVSPFFDDFSSDKLNVAWTWNYPFANVKTELKSGNLYLTGAPKKGSLSGGALCLRPASASYLLETALVGQTSANYGITMYGDDRHFLAFLRIGDRMQLHFRQGESLRVLSDVSLPETAAVYLRMQVKEGLQSVFSWSVDRKTWQPIPVTLSDEEFRSLVCWDRMPRPGLYHEGTESGCYAYVSVLNE